MSGLIHHIDLTVTTKRRSRRFYDVLPSLLGYRRSAVFFADPEGLKLEFMFGATGQ